MKAVKPRKWMLLALLLAALGGRAETVRLRTGLESVPGTMSPCNATLTSGDFASEVMIVNGSYTTANTITFTPPPGDVSPFFLSAGAASGYEFVEWRVTTLDPSLVMFFDGREEVPSLSWNNFCRMSLGREISEWASIRESCSSSCSDNRKLRIRVRGAEDRGNRAIFLPQESRPTPAQASVGCCGGLKGEPPISDPFTEN